MARPSSSRRCRSRARRARAGRGLPRGPCRSPWDIFGTPVGRTRARVHQHDLERRELMIDAFELGFDVARAGDITIGEMTEVELDGGLKAPFEWYLVDCDRALAAIHGGGHGASRCVVLWVESRIHSIASLRDLANPPRASRERT